MIKICSVLLVFTMVYNIYNPKTKQEIYIDRYSSLAVFEMELYKVPASITLAQAILESSSGYSDLAINANNHFGIKCKDTWMGETYLYTDDLNNECFRKYSNIEDSYRDHSYFLRFRPRYSSLFRLDIHDYKGWARGLQRSGYATNKDYSEKLVNIIERYELYNLDY